MVSFSRPLIVDMERAASNTLPKEACGLLLGECQNNVVTISACIFSENMSQSDPEASFEIDPALHFRLLREAQGGGAQIVGVWHSHPDALARPSRADMARSVEPGWLWIISGWQNAVWKTAAFVAGNPDTHHFETLSMEVL